MCITFIIQCLLPFLIINWLTNLTVQNCSATKTGKDLLHTMMKIFIINEFLKKQKWYIRHLIFGPVPRCVEVCLSLQMSKLDFIRSHLGDNTNREFHLQKFVAFMPINLQPTTDGSNKHHLTQGQMMVPPGLEARKRLQAHRTYLCYIDLVLVLFLLLPCFSLAISKVVLVVL